MVTWSQWISPTSLSHIDALSALQLLLSQSLPQKLPCVINLAYLQQTKSDILMFCVLFLLCCTAVWNLWVSTAIHTWPFSLFYTGPVCTKEKVNLCLCINTSFFYMCQKIMKSCLWKQELVNCSFVLVDSLARICDDNVLFINPLS